MWTSHRPKYTYVFMVACAAVYLLMQGTRLWAYLAFTPALATRLPWTLVTSVFLHIDFSHLLFNMFALLLFGSALERMIGSRVFAALYIASGLVGNVGYYFTAGSPVVPVLGASGAIYGVIGTLAVIEPFRVVYFYGMLPLPMVAAAAMWALADVTGLFVPSGVAHSVHLVGMLVGVVVGLYLRRVDGYSLNGYSW